MPEPGNRVPIEHPDWPTARSRELFPAYPNLPLCATRRFGLNADYGYYIRGLGILAYLVVDAITPYDEPREQIELHLWRYEGGRVREMVPDEEGWLALPEMGLKVTAKELQLVFADEVSGEVLLDTEQWAMALREAESRAEAEAAARRAAEAEIARLRVLLAEKEADG